MNQPLLVIPADAANVSGKRKHGLSINVSGQAYNLIIAIATK